jgi:uncharacterized protein YhaN
MSIHLKQVNIKNLGPISKLSFDMGQFNVIYGRNEMGKTFLTEFLIASLFKDRSAWSLRNLNGQGRVLVSGLGSEEIAFSPESDMKLEDYWEEKSLGLPTNLARLLVVKGGRPAISNNVSGGVGRNELKQIVSRDIMLEQILGQFQTTVRDASLFENVIEGPRRGKLRDREEAYEAWQRRTDLLETVHAEYSTGGVKDLEIEVKKLFDRLEQQTQAKRHKAYLLDERISKLSSEQSQIDDNDLQKLRDLINREEDLQDDIKQIGEGIEEKQILSKHHNWLSNALSQWEEKSLGEAKLPSLGVAVAALLIILFSFISSLISVMIFQGRGNISASVISIIAGTVLLFIGLFLSGYWFWGVRKWAQNVTGSEERTNIVEEFQNRFGKSINSLTDLKTQFDTVNTAYAQVMELKDRLHEKIEAVKDTTNKINQLFWTVVGKEIEDSKQWREALRSVVAQREDLKKRLNACQLDLHGLGIDKEDYRHQPTEIEYDKDEEKRLLVELEETDEILTKAKSDLEGLEAEVRGVTGDRAGTPWATLVHNLQEACRRSADKYKDLTAHILAAIGLNEVLEEVREQEDEQIQHAINTPEVTNAIKAVTGQYSKLEMIDNRVIVSGEFSEYPLSDLSTSTREQIQLALRMGMASRFAAGEPLFMILDDAFQHSDWIRREKLIDLVIGMVGSGWQMIYLTMDDHIRDTARELAGGALGNDFRSFEISGI